MGGEIICRTPRRCTTNFRHYVRRHNERRILLWFEEYEYLVVLAERNGYCLLWTAYPVTRDHGKRKLLKEYTLYKAKAAR